MFPVFPAGTVEPWGAVGAAPATLGSVKVTLKQSTLFGVVVSVNGAVMTPFPNTPHVTTAPRVVALGLPSIMASVAETVSVDGEKMMPDPPVVAGVIAKNPLTGSVIVIGNVALLVAPPTVLTAVIVALPCFMPVTIPVVLTLAIVGSLEKNAGRPIPDGLLAARWVATVAPEASV